MRILLSWADKGPELVGLMHELGKHSHQIVYVIAHPNLDISEFPEAILHSYVDATNNIPPKEINPNQFPPVGKDIIDKFEYKYANPYYYIFDKEPLKNATYTDPQRIAEEIKRNIKLNPEGVFIQAMAKSFNVKP